MSPGHTTQLLNDGDIDILLDHVLDRLRGLARKVKGGSPVDTDELVDGAVVKVLMQVEPRTWENSKEFFRIMACAMRQVQIEGFRKFRPHEPLAADPVARQAAPDDNVVLDDLTAFLLRQLDEFAKEDEMASRVMREHLFGGKDGDSLNIKAVAERLELEPAVVYRLRKKGRIALRRMIRSRLGDERGGRP